MKICLDISTACPAKCRYCLHQYKGLVKPRFMEEGVFNEILGILKREKFNYVYPYLSGEPVIHPRFWKMIGAMSAAGITTDTASKLPVEIDAGEMESGLEKAKAPVHFDVTIDASKQETQDKISCGTMKTDTIFKNLETLSSYSRHIRNFTVSVITVVNRFNEAELPQIRKRVMSCGIKQWCSKPMGFYMGYLMDDSDMKNIVEMASRFGSPRFTISAGQIKSKMRECTGFMKPVIGPEGQVTVCCHDMLYQQAVKNVIKVGSLLAIINSSEFRKASQDGHFMRLPICKGCN